MSKLIKQMEMDALKKTFTGVRDMLVLSTNKLAATAENSMRLGLRKKNIRLQMVKNSLARRVLGELGIKLSQEAWVGSTVLAWGAESIKDLSKALDEFVKKTHKDKVKVKTAVADGQQVSFERALTMPTRLEAIAEVVGMILSPGAQIAGCLIGPSGAVASQIQKKSEATEAAPA